ncbi:MAG: c-type cytochrome [Bacteroidetes bacterium]|nr:c-type cytochrome [Bacteroidota bacterium]
MKKTNYLWIAWVVVLIGTIISCGGKKSDAEAKEDYGAPKEEAATPTASNAIAEGESLVKANDCKTCHHTNDKLIGPAHLDVAKKYDFTEANVKLLAHKIISGGTGVWGQIPMTPHANVSETDAEKMARYVLSLDGEKEH